MVGDWLVVQTGGYTWFVVSRWLTFADASRNAGRGQIVVRDDWP